MRATQQDCTEAFESSLSRKCKSQSERAEKMEYVECWIALAFYAFICGHGISTSLMVPLMLLHASNLCETLWVSCAAAVKAANMYALQCLWERELFIVRILCWDVEEFLLLWIMIYSYKVEIFRERVGKNFTLNASQACE